MARGVLYSFRLLLSLALICLFVADIRHIEAAEFDELSDEQKGAAMELLKRAMSETNVDPLELIRKGMEKVKEDQEKIVMSDQPQSQSSSNAPADESILPSTPPAVERLNSVSTTEETTYSKSQPEDDATSKFSNSPDDTSTIPTEAFGTSSTTERVTEDNLTDTIQSKSSGPTPVYEPAPILITSSTTDAPVTTVPLPTQPTENTSVVEDNNELDQEGQQKNSPVDQVTSRTPTDGDYENVFIDESDPNNPKQVHVKNRTKSKFDENGFSHEHQESVSSTSIGNNPNVFSKHSSSFSSSGSSNAFVNGKQVKPISWTYNTMKPFSSIPPIPKIPSIPPMPGMPTMPPMPIMPFGSIMAGPWPGYFSQNYEEMGYPVQSSAYAGAYSVLPENFFGMPSTAPMSRRKAKKLARKQERAARRAQEFEYYN